MLRVASEEDVEKAAELAEKGEEALSVFKEMAAQTSDQMRPVMVEFLLDGDKAVFYFEAEERIDFRDLVRKLASRFHVRVDMRQIGVRDGARIIGGLGHCGQELCCKRLGGEFSPVSIRMAKEQNLSLNPQKISGCCGRLMCCLRYEYEAYKEVNARAPKHGGKVEVPDGVARVTEVNVPLERVTLQLEDGTLVKIPLEEMEIVGDGKRPNKVSAEVLEKHSAPDPFEVLESTSFEVPSFTGADKLADPAARSQGGKAADEGEKEGHRKPRRRRRGGGNGDGAAGGNGNGGNGSADAKRDANKQVKRDESKKDGSSRKPRRRTRSNAAKQGGQNAGNGNGANANGQASNAQAEQRTDRANNNRKRPGQKSSGIRNAPRKSEGAQGAQAGTSRSNGGAKAASNGETGQVTHRKPRRRRQKSGGETSNEK